MSEFLAGVLAGFCFTVVFGSFFLLFEDDDIIKNLKQKRRIKTYKPGAVVCKLPQNPYESGPCLLIVSTKTNADKQTSVEYINCDENGDYVLYEPKVCSAKRIYKDGYVTIKNKKIWQK